MDKKKIAIVVMSGNFLMDFAGPADVFRHANALRDMYEVLLISPDGETVNGIGGLQINSNALRDLDNIDTLLIVGKYTEEQFVSADILGNTHSSIVDGNLTKSIGKLVKVVAWYDNEVGISNRIAELVSVL
jgi:transcriptional regulator GlxA family with amidase domain